MVMFVGLNPSTADEATADPTVRRCLDFAQAWGYSGMYMANLFAFRSTDPLRMKRADEPIGPHNDAWLVAMAKAAALVVAAWGNEACSMKGDRPNAVRQLLAQVKPVYALRLTKLAQPWHPLYLPKTLRPRVWNVDDARLEDYAETPRHPPARLLLPNS